MIINGQDLLDAAPIRYMAPTKVVAYGMTYGLGEAGYDIRIKQEIKFKSAFFGLLRWVVVDGKKHWGRFTLASAIEEFKMPDYLLGHVCDKSSWARKGLSVFNTIIEPGWKGYLTLELVYKGNGELVIPAGAPIAQVVFHEIENPAEYAGRYQNQENEPTSAKEAE